MVTKKKIKTVVLETALKNYADSFGVYGDLTWGHITNNTIEQIEEKVRQRRDKYMSIICMELTKERLTGQALKSLYEQKALVWEIGE